MQLNRKSKSTNEFFRQHKTKDNRKRKGKRRTHIFICIFNKRIASWFAFQRSRFVEEIINTRDFAKLGKHLYEGIPWQKMAFMNFGTIRVVEKKLGRRRTRQQKDGDSRHKFCPWTMGKAVVGKMILGGMNHPQHWEKDRRGAHAKSRRLGSPALVMRLW